MRKPLAALLGAVLLAGCAVGPDYRRPEVELPAAWKDEAAPANRAAAAGERWWSLYGDPVLERLVDEALLHNADVQVAAARVLEARALAGITDADRYPVVSAGASASRTRSSLATDLALPPGTPRIQNSRLVTLDAAYEVDLWGRYRRASEAARAELLAAEAARDTVQLSLAAQAVQQYFSLISADEQYAAVERVLATRGETVALLRRRLEAGVSSEFELRQAEAEQAAARSQLAAARQARARQESALALLLGRSPREVMEGTLPRGTPPAPGAPWVPDGLPSDLMLRRPDLRQAEQQLVAANARIGAARAQYFPAITLTGFVGSESSSLANLFSGPAGVFQFAAALTQPIFNAGRVGYGVEAEEARRDQALVQYRQAVAAAFRDVRDALAAQTAARETLEAETARTAALQQTLQKATQRVEAGLTSRLELLDAERNLLASELTRIDAQRAQRAAVADLFKALGGGWRSAPGR